MTGAAITCVAAVSAGCGTSAAPAAAPTKTVTATPPPAASTSATAAPSSAPAAAAACPTRYLGAKTIARGVAAGTSYTAIDFTNISNVPCTLYGYPGVSLAGGSPVTQIGLAATEDPLAARTLVTLGPGGVASAQLGIGDAGNYPASKCDPVTATYLQVFPPNQTTPIYLRYTAQACSKPTRILSVSVVVAGADGPS